MSAQTSKPLPALKGPFWLYLALISIPILALQGLVYVQIVDQTVGAFPIMKRLRMVTGEIPEPKVAVLRSDINAAYSGPKPEYYYDLAAFWDFQAGSADFEHRLITDADLERGLGNSATVLILPWTTCLTSKQKQAIRDFLNAGNSIIATGPMGARNEKNEWAGWDFLSEITGLMQLVSITPEEDTYASFRGQQFYSGTVPAGLQLLLPKHVLTVGLGQTPDIYWSDASWRPYSVNWPSEAALGTHGVYGKGRFIWMGFNERLSGDPKLRPLVDNYLQAAIQWAGRQPLAVPQSWPGNKAMATVAVGEFGTGIDAAQKAAETFRSEQVPATFFFASSAAQTLTASRTVRGLVEIGTTGDSTDAFQGQSLMKQVDRLKTAKKELDLPKAPVLGFKPPQDTWSAETLLALRTAGFGYFLDGLGNNRAVPELIQFRSGSMWGGPTELSRIPAAWPGDLDIVADYTGPTPWKEDVGDGFLRDYELGMYLGGVYTLNIRQELLGARENSAILKSVLHRMKQNNNVWFSSASDLADWWSRREKMRIESRLVHQHRIRIAVTNRGREAMDRFVVNLHLPYRPNKVRILSEILGKAPPKYELLADEDVLRLEFINVKRQGSLVFLVALDES